MARARDLVRQIRRLDEFELRRLLILVRGLLLEVDGHPVDEPGLPSTLTYRQEHVRCGKDSCSRCPHGPYWYAYWREEGRTRKRYIGRHLPGQPLQPVQPDPEASTASAAERVDGSAGRRDRGAEQGRLSGGQGGRARGHDD